MLPLRRAITFGDFDAYEADGPLQGGQVTLVGRGTFMATVRRAPTPDFRIMHRHTLLAHVLRGGTPSTIIFALSGTPDGPHSIVNGVPRGGNDLVFIPPCSDLLIHDPGGTAWSMNLSPQAFEAAAAAVLGAPASLAPRGPTTLSAAPEAMARLRAALRAAVGGAGEVVPRAVSDDVLLGLLATLPRALPTESPSTARRRAVVAGLVDLADGNERLSLIEVCGRLGVPLRTLNSCANAVLGLSAAAYLRRRRLHAARAALLRGVASVTEAAMAHGFWELGRFAADYRAAFGELPATSLRRVRHPGSLNAGRSSLC